MIAWINFAVLLISTFLFVVFYIRSVSPAGRDMVIGLKAYTLSFYDRLLAGTVEFVILGNYIIYHFYPLDTPLPALFPWPWVISLILAMIIGIPASVLMVVGMRDAGEETLRPKKEHTMYGGIYSRIRHPQATGEVFLFLVIALVLHSPFLTLFSFVYFPIFFIICFAEEQDLLLRYGDAYNEYQARVPRFIPRLIHKTRR
jgi:protein-S-isoprenylcysteine O-methyltransferase Ste14